MDPIANKVARRFLGQEEAGEQVADWEVTIRDPEGDEPLNLNVGGPPEGEHLAVAPPGWEGPIKEMKKDKDIDNPWALAWYMKNKGDKVHKEAVDPVAYRVATKFIDVQMASRVAGSFGQVPKDPDAPVDESWRSH